MLELQTAFNFFFTLEYQELIPGMSGKTQPIVVDFDAIKTFTFSLPIEFKRTREYVWIYEIDKSMFFLSVDLGKPMAPETAVEMLLNRSRNSNCQVPQVTKVSIEGKR